MALDATRDARLTSTGAPEQEWRLSVQLLRTGRRQLLCFGALVGLFSVLALLYFLNLARWTEEPDLGWSVVFDIDGTVITQSRGEAAKAGLRATDRIVAVNDVRFARFSEMQRAVDRGVPGQNVYLVDREGELVAITVPNRRAGWARSFERFGFTWGLAVVFFVLGAVAYAMKPGTAASWAFLIAVFHAALWIMFSFTSRLLPAWLSVVPIYAVAMLPASVLHLAQVFPVRRQWLGSSKRLLGVVYLLAAGLFAAMLWQASHYADVPKELRDFAQVFWIAALLVFLGSIVVSSIAAAEPLVRARSRIVLLGSAAASVVPAANLVSVMAVHKDLLPHPTFNLVFYVFFPASIAYAIARHNLFDANDYIRRAVGYGAMTAIVAGGYFALQTGMTLTLEPLLGKRAQQAYSIIFALVVVFLFEPVKRRVQDGVDRLFFRKEYDYRETVLAVESALESVLDRHEILSRIIQIARERLFIDSAGVVAIGRDPGKCLPYFVGDTQSPAGRDLSQELCVLPTDPLTALIRQRQGLVTRYDIEEDPRYREHRATCTERFKELGATMGLPLISRGEVLGVLFVGRKKSGKTYARADVDILQTLCARGAAAMSNAILAEDMRKEETVRANLARFLSPDLVDQVVKRNMDIELGGERKVATVLFSDIRNFTTIVESRPADELVRMLNEYLTAMAEIIFEHQGSLDKYIGDAIVAVFGNVVAAENAPANAVRAAMAMMQRLTDLRGQWSRTYGVTLEIGVGITTGEVTLGNVGSPKRMEYTVIGDTVNVASRLSGLARGGQILLDRRTADAVSAGIRLTRLAPANIKGKTEAVELFEVVSGQRCPKIV